MTNDLRNIPMMTRKNKIDIRESNYNIEHKNGVIIEISFCMRMK